MKSDIKIASIFKTFTIILLVLCILASLTFLIGFYIIANSYEDNFIGSLEGNGQLYCSYDNLFTFRNSYSGVKRRYYKDWIDDEINEVGYNLSYKKTGHNPFHLIIFSRLLTKDVFKEKVLLIAGKFDSLLAKPYFEDFEESGYKCTFHTLLVPSKTINDSDSLVNKELSAVLFCYNDSLSLLLRTSRKYSTTFTNHEFDKSVSNNEKRLLLNYIRYSLVVNDIIYKEGIPEPLSDNKIRMIRNNKRIMRLLENLVTFGRANYKKQDVIFKKFKLRKS